MLRAAGQRDVHGLRGDQRVHPAVRNFATAYPPPTGHAAGEIRVKLGKLSDVGHMIFQIEGDVGVTPSRQRVGNRW